MTLLCGAGCAGAHDRDRQAGRAAQSADRAFAARQGVCRVRQSVRCRHDRPDRLLVRLPRHEGLRLLLLLGTDFPYRQFYPEGATVAQVDIRAENLGRRAISTWAGGRRRWRRSRRCCPSSRRRPRRQVSRRRRRTTPRRARISTSSPRASRAASRSIRSISPRCSSELAGDDAVFTCDVGETDGLGGALPDDERPAAADRLVQPRLDGECLAAGDRRAGGVPRPPGRLDVGRRRLLDADGRLASRCASSACR